MVKNLSYKLVFWCLMVIQSFSFYMHFVQDTDMLHESDVISEFSNLNKICCRQDFDLRFFCKAHWFLCSFGLLDNINILRKSIFERTSPLTLFRGAVGKTTYPYVFSRDTKHWPKAKACFFSDFNIIQFYTFCPNFGFIPPMDQKLSNFCWW